MTSMRAVSAVVPMLILLTGGNLKLVVPSNLRSVHSEPRSIHLQSHRRLRVTGDERLVWLKIGRCRMFGALRHCSGWCKCRGEGSIAL